MPSYKKIGGSDKLYQHNLVITHSIDTTTEIYLKIFNNSNIKISSYSDILSFLENNNFVVKTGFVNPYQATGVYQDAYDNTYYCWGIIKNQNFVAVRCLSGKNIGTYTLSETGCEVEDTIIQLL